jgi:hypothetical protein
VYVPEIYVIWKLRNGYRKENERVPAKQTTHFSFKLFLIKYLMHLHIAHLVITSQKLKLDQVKLKIKK